jgi:hypothetical protein
MTAVLSTDDGSAVLRIGVKPHHRRGQHAGALTSPRVVGWCPQVGHLRGVSGTGPGVPAVTTISCVTGAMSQVMTVNAVSPISNGNHAPWTTFCQVRFSRPTDRPAGRPRHTCGADEVQQ